MLNLKYGGKKRYSRSRSRANNQLGKSANFADLENRSVYNQEAQNLDLLNHSIGLNKSNRSTVKKMLASVQPSQTRDDLFRTVKAQTGK